MGRDSTGAITVNDCLRLSSNSFAAAIKNHSFNRQVSLSWEGGANISVTVRVAGKYHTLELEYNKTESGEKIPIKYIVWIVGKPSNLGTGTIYYFLCPFTYKQCRFLYMGYGSRYFKSREAYGHRIYYRSQLSSRLDKHNDTYWRLERMLEKLYIKHPKTHYKGKETRVQKRLERLKQKKRYHDAMRWQVLPVAIQKMIGSNGVTISGNYF